MAGPSVEFVLGLRDDATPGLKTATGALRDLGATGTQAAAQLDALGGSLARVRAQADAVGSARLSLAATLVKDVPGGAAALDAFGKTVAATSQRGVQAAQGFAALSQ